VIAFTDIGKMLIAAVKDVDTEGICSKQGELVVVSTMRGHRLHLDSQPLLAVQTKGQFTKTRTEDEGKTVPFQDKKCAGAQHVSTPHSKIKPAAKKKLTKR
jgi:hypothetical protein